LSIPVTIVLGLALAAPGCGTGDGEASGTSDRIEKTTKVADEVDYPFGKPAAKKLPPSLAKKIAATPKDQTGPGK
jgi:hypothetical protein